MTEPLYIDDPETLAGYCQRLEHSDWIALDTEFIREKTYRSRLCLVQIADRDGIACVDPLALPDIEPLLEVLYRPGLLKVLHAAHQDLEIFYGLRGSVPGPVFDTQLAAALAGYGAQVGYARLVEAMLGIRLDKSHVRADWSRRPLSAEEIRYAADDVRYLREVYPRLRDDLAARGRLEWLTEDLLEMTRPERYASDPDNAWQRIRGASRLKPRQFHALCELAAWREGRARDRDRPRQWIVKDDVLLSVAQRLPRTTGELARLRGVGDPLVREAGEELLAIVDRARQAEQPRQPPAHQEGRLDEDQEPLVDLLMALVRMRGGEQDVSPSLLAGRRDIERLILGERELPVLTGWRRQVVGEELLAALEGQRRFVIRDGRLDVDSGDRSG